MMGQQDFGTKLYYQLSIDELVVRFRQVEWPGVLLCLLVHLKE